MSGIVNGYVFPPPLLAHPPFGARGEQEFLKQSPRPSSHVEHRGVLHNPNFSVESQPWSHYPEVSFPQPHFCQQLNQRMPGSTPFSRKRSCHIDAPHCKGFGRPFKQPNGHRIDHSKKKCWTPSGVGKTADVKYYCEPCEKEFKSVNDKIAHFKQHVKCQVESCNFFASRKIIKLHYIQNHEIGKFRIVLKNDDDIEKWREDRRKNYPSAAIKSERLAQEKARKCHGNVLQKRNFSYKGNGKWKRGNLSKSQSCVMQETNKNTENTMTNKDHSDVKKLDSSCEENEARGVNICSLQEKPEVVSRSGLESLKQYYDSSENDESDDESSLIEGSKQALLRSTDSTFSRRESEKGKLSLDTHCNFEKEADNGIKIKYDDVKSIKHEDCVEVGMKEVPDSTNWSLLQQRSEIESCKVGKKPTEQNEKSRQEIKENRTLGSNRKRKHTVRGNGKSHNHGRICRKSRPTLLEMLLANDIKHERNIILQCIRFVTKKKFFGIDVK